MARFDIYAIYRNVSPWFRARRMRRFMERIRPGPDTAILDVGGFPGTWRGFGCESRIRVLNIHEIEYTPVADAPPIELAVGDGCALPHSDGAFDVVFSNSVIEHVGSFERQRAFAAEAMRCGRALWIQTPSRWFFIEPHLIAPFVHYLPRTLQRHLLRRFTVWGWMTKPTREEVDLFLEETRLLTLREMRELFPGCDILRERFLFMTKSFIAVRDGPVRQGAVRGGAVKGSTAPRQSEGMR